MDKGKSQEGRGRGRNDSHGEGGSRQGSQSPGPSRPSPPPQSRAQRNVADAQHLPTSSGKPNASANPPKDHPPSPKGQTTTPAQSPRLPSSEPVAGPSHQQPPQPLVQAPAANESYQEPPIDNRRWVPFKLIPSFWRIPPALKELFMAQIFEESISRFQYVATIANLAMIETGFVPVVNREDPEFAAEELMIMPKQRRMNRLIDILKDLYKQKLTLKSVHYRFLKRVNPETLSEQPHYIYGDFQLKLGVWHDVDTFVGLKGNGEHKVFQLHILANYIHTLSNWERLSLRHMMDRFNGDRLIADIKCELCTYFVDNIVDCYHAEVIGFNMLPNEIIMYFAEFLDLRTFARLLRTNRRNRDILEDEALWRNLLDRIPRDFAQYELPVPSTTTLRDRIQETGISNREKYRRLYNEALAQDRRTHRRRSRQYPLRFPFMF